MNKKIIGLTLMAGGLLVGAQVTGYLPTPHKFGSLPVAQAATAETILSGQFSQDRDSTGYSAWHLTSDGVLHIEPGKLPLQSGKASPLNQAISEARDKNIPVKNISFDGHVVAPADSSYLLAELLPTVSGDVYAPQIKNWQNLDVSGVTNMRFFLSNSHQKSIDVSSFDTSNVTDMHGMFAGNYRFIDGVKGIDHLKTSKVTDMGEMFSLYGDNSDTGNPPVDLDLSNFDVGNVTDGVGRFGAPQEPFAQMFQSSGIKTLNLANWQPKAPIKNLFENAVTISKITLGKDIRLINADPDTDSNLSIYTQLDKYADYDGNWINIKDQYLPTDQKTLYTPAKLMALYAPDSISHPTQDETYIWNKKIPQGNPVAIHYVDQDGKTLKEDDSQGGELDTKYTIKPASIAGYEFVKATEGTLTGTLTSNPQQVTLVYRKAPVTPTTPDSSTGSSSTDSTSSPTLETLPALKKGQAITAVKKLGLYRTPNFSNRSREFYYAKQPRIKRPQFVVTGVAQSHAGHKRYLVRDVTPNSKRKGRVGYLTAKSTFIVGTYYQHAPKKVLLLTNVNAYREAALTHQVKHFKRGKILRVKGIVHYHLTTRLVLTNGTYITSNKAHVLAK